MRFLQIILTIYIFVSFTTNKNIAGIYKSKNKIGGEATLMLSEKDSTYDFQFNPYDLARSNSDGTWHLNNDTFILNSYYQPVQVIDSYHFNSDSLLIKVIDEKSIPITYFNCSLTQSARKLYLLPNSKGELFSPNIYFDSIVISSIGYHTISFKIKDPSINFYEFQMRSANYLYFTSQLFFLKRKKIYLADSKFPSLKFSKK